jgi:phosphatidylserine/phosphatidylglycerophosphate/cardiolipin synthase-like enzyme
MLQQDEVGSDSSPQRRVNISGIGSMHALIYICIEVLSQAADVTPRRGDPAMVTDVQLPITVAGRVLGSSSDGGAAAEAVLGAVVSLVRAAPSLTLSGSDGALLLTAARIAVPGAVGSSSAAAAAGGGGSMLGSGADLVLQLRAEHPICAALALQALADALPVTSGREVDDSWWRAAAFAVPSASTGRLIGRSGDTVRAIEEATGGQLVVGIYLRMAGHADDDRLAACALVCDKGHAAAGAAAIRAHVATIASDPAPPAIPAELIAVAGAELRDAVMAAPAGSFSSSATAAESSSSGAAARCRVVFFRPDEEATADRHDPGGKQLRQVLQSVDLAAETVDVAIYALTDNRVRDSLISAASRGVRVRVLADEEEAGAVGGDVPALRDAGIPVRTQAEAETRLFHHKILIVDTKVVITGSLNLTRHATSSNWENMVVVASERLAEDFAAEFSRLWRIAASRGADKILAPAPDLDRPLLQQPPAAAAATGTPGADVVNCSASAFEPIFFPCGSAGLDRIRHYIESARSELRVASLTITSDEVREAIAARHRAGARVRVLADAGKSAGKGSDIEWLAEQGVPVKTMAHAEHASGMFHHKVRQFALCALVGPVVALGRLGAAKTCRSTALWCVASL